MTRENKLALVVGFGLLLLVGILVSDHFSPARIEAAGDLRAGSEPAIAGRTAWQPTSTRPASTPDDRGTSAVPPLDPDSGRSNRGRPGTEAPGADEDRTPVAPPGGRRTVDPPDDSRAERASDPPDEPTGGVKPGGLHVVVAGDTLEGIARRYYGDRRFVAALARVNGITDPSTIQLGQEILLPPAELLQTGASAFGDPPGEADQPAPERRAYWFYTVRKNDTLSQIAQEHLQTARAWTVIMDLNPDVLQRSTDLRPGQRLRMPSKQG